MLIQTKLFQSRAAGRERPLHGALAATGSRFTPWRFNPSMIANSQSMD
jgi:hypothetical protein